jgi:hypothetical protein
MTRRQARQLRRAALDFLALLGVFTLLYAAWVAL